jgi:hypothetical protein
MMLQYWLVLTLIMFRYFLPYKYYLYLTVDDLQNKMKVCKQLAKVRGHG